MRLGRIDAEPKKGKIIDKQLGENVVISNSVATFLNKYEYEKHLEETRDIAKEYPELGLVKSLSVFEAWVKDLIRFHQPQFYRNHSALGIGFAIWRFKDIFSTVKDAFGIDVQQHEPKACKKLLEFNDKRNLIVHSGSLDENHHRVRIKKEDVDDSLKSIESIKSLLEEKLSIK